MPHAAAQTIRAAAESEPRAAAARPASAHPAAERLNASPAVQRLHGTAELLAARPAAIAVTQRANRTGLPDRLKAGIEALSGVSMDDVRVHRNSREPAQLKALAHTRGSDIHLGPGQEHHLAHEAWHVVQQKQGRVRPTLQLNGSVPVNDDRRLEREADDMGARAMAQPAGAAPQRDALRDLPTAGGGAAPVQGVFIVDSTGAVVWRNDPYVLQQGESYYNPFAQQPSVLLDQGQTEVRFDSQGKKSIIKRKTTIPTHEEMQEQREKQGKRIRKRLKLDPTIIAAETKKISSIATKLEGSGGTSVPKQHDKKIRARFKKGEVSGEQFRRVIKAKDELTQSQATTSFIRGLRESGGDTPPHYSQHLDDFAENALRLMSSLRAPTESIVAPVEHQGTTRGMQHPTSKSQPVLEEGASSHSFSDRARVEAQISTFDAVSKDPKAPPSSIFLASTLSGPAKTLSTMAAPTSSANLPTFHPSRMEQQVRERELIKDQTNILASAIGVPTSTDVQDYDAEWRAYETPTSPRRNPKSAPKITKVPPPSTTTASQQGPATSVSTPSTQSQQPTQSSFTQPAPTSQGSTPSSQSKPTALPSSLSGFTSSTVSPSLLQQPVKQPIKKVTDLVGSVRRTAQQLLAVMPGPQNDQDDQNRQTFRTYMQQVYAFAGQLDHTDANNEQVLSNVLGSMNQMFVWYRGLIRRRVFAPAVAEDPLSARGERLGALEQFFAECGQMAAHNAMVLAAHADPASQNARQAFRNEHALGQRGTFQNNVTEVAIRAMTSQRHDVPVVGNLQQLGGIMGLLRQQNLLGLLQNQIGVQEQLGAQAVIDFVDGNTDSLVMVVNTDSHKGLKAQGYHWISVKITRRQDGQLAIQYLDSLAAPADYSQLFLSLRQFLGHVPPQQHPAPQQQQQQGQQGQKSTT